MYKKHVDYALDCASEHVAGRAATARCVRCMCVCVMWIVNPAKSDLSRAITPNVYVVVSKVSKCRAADSVTQNRQKWLRLLVSVHIAVKCGRVWIKWLSRCRKIQHQRRIVMHILQTLCTAQSYVCRCITFAQCNESLSIVLWHCWLGDRKGIRPVQSLVLICWWWRFDWSFARLVAPDVATTSIILSCNETGYPRFTWKNGR